jgi:hypothetical protein
VPDEYCALDPELVEDGEQIGSVARHPVWTG